MNREPSALIPPSPEGQIVASGRLCVLNPRYVDLDGQQDLDKLYFHIGEQSEGAQSVQLLYDHSEGLVYLQTPNGMDGGLPPGSNITLENDLVRVIGSQCQVQTVDSKTLEVNWALEFKPSFQGRHPLYMRAMDRWGASRGGDTGWQAKGEIDIEADPFQNRRWLPQLGG